MHKSQQPFTESRRILGTNFPDLIGVLSLDSQGDIRPP